ncbi:MAG: tryptophan--tRNA ligase [Acidobacteria bacterium]|nr:tryptophan--tRNA ligase [Acidobacteriota bacterium]
MAQGNVVLSGNRATGRLHLGNYFGAVKNWVDLQDKYRCYYFVADWHALTTDYDDTTHIADNSLEVLADWLAAGLDPERSVLFLQSLVPEHAELHLLLSMITPLGWLERVPSYKEQIRELKNRDLSTYGFLGYPVLQTADILLYRADFVPVGQDQASHLELSREITRRFNRRFGDVFPEPKALFTPTPKVPGVDGRKMSKSYGNAIDLADTPDQIRAKCRSMFTDPTRLRRTDAGHPETCNLFAFHELVSSPEIKERVARECRLAQIGCVDDKELIADQLIAFLDPIRRRREAFAADRGELLNILRKGSEQARERAADTMARVRAGMRLDYEWPEQERLGE